ncbi:hypothetical protein AK830_g11685 [Neonectria ditissima]|uniref:CHAT domain-containing protein n=1 Tax=Neonectria ditissima TaxID=78410 RepID=A0A0P7B2K2_9HYPO|nr:hypothetical protein AK830_g11685 [Neonectria ditissima]
MQNTPNQKPLKHASDEVDAVVAVCESMGLPLDWPRPHKADVSSALEACRMFHFAGHGSTHPTEPLQSQLLLDDWDREPFTVASLLETNLTSHPPFLAYLSACGTGQILDERSVDESIHLAKDCQLAGFRHAVGTLWSVDDGLCVDMARMTYEFLRDEGIRDDCLDGSYGWEPRENILHEELIQQFKEGYKGFGNGVEVLPTRIKNVQSPNSAVPQLCTALSAPHPSTSAVPAQLCSPFTSSESPPTSASLRLTNCEGIVCAIEHAAEQATEQAAEQATEQAAEQATEHAAEQATEHAAEQATEHAAEQATEHAAEQLVYHRRTPNKSAKFYSKLPFQASSLFINFSMATIEQDEGEALQPINFTTIEKLFDAINCTTRDTLLVHGVSAQQFAEIEKAEEEQGRKFRFHYTPPNLIITIPTDVHETLHVELWNPTRDAIVRMGLSASWRSICSATRQSTQDASSSRSDSSGGPRPDRGYPGAWPTLVIEAGYSQTLPALRSKMRWWFSASDHQVKIVLIAKFELRTRRIIIEKYIEGPVQSQPGATRAQAAAVQEPACTQVITITEDPNHPTSYNVTRGALRLEFHLLFLRQPRQQEGEGDIVISTEELQEYAASVWCTVA